MASRKDPGRLRIHPSLLQRSRDLRHPLTPPEEKLWRRLRDHRLGYHIRRQQVLLGRYIADFYCADAHLCIEVDGDSHAGEGQERHDATRTTELESHGYRVIRFTNREVSNNLEAVLEAIAQACEIGASGRPH